MRIKLIAVIILFAWATFIALLFPWNKAQCIIGTSAEGKLPVVTASSTTSERAVSALGRLEPASHVIRVAAPSGNEGNRLESLLVDEGNDVVKGDVLGYMDTYSRRLAAQGQEEARLATAVAKLNQVLQGNKLGDIEAAQALVESAERDLATRVRDRDRAESLKRNHAISDAEVDEYRLAHERSIATVRQTKAQLAAVSEVREVDVEMAKAEVRLAQSSVDLAKANVQATQIVAPCDGRILRIHVRPGEQITSAGLLELGRVDQMQAVAEVFEGDIPDLKTGDEAVVTIDTTGHRLNGRVREIGHLVARKAVLTNDPVSDTDARVVEVRIDLEQSQLEWITRLSNARVNVRIGPRATATLQASTVGSKQRAPGNRDVK